ncbi:MAG: hypothetical protein BGN95_03925 [Sphingomonas sp. 66-10]|nr:MAG: hypothetical protein BGN95_03925 [Sphingomonas sp. 66-10]
MTMLLAACATDRPPPRQHGWQAHHAEGGDDQPHYLFFSPMGEPFRVEHPDKAWFAGADTNHDGRLDRAEFRADALRFFHVLDRNNDGEIDPDASGGHGGGRGGGRGGGGHRGGGGGFGGGGPGGRGGSESASRPTSSQAQGAASWSYIGLPEPVTAADTNLNRGVDTSEFLAAADQRFMLLDRNGDGVITPGELPAVDTRARGGIGGDRGRPPGDHPFRRPVPPDVEDDDRAPQPAH